MSLPTFPKPEIERIAAQIAGMLKERINPAFGGDIHNPFSWADALRGICGLSIREDWTHAEQGCCFAEVGCDDEPCRALFVAVLGNSRRPSFLAQVIVHEAAHAYLWNFVPDCWVEDLWTQYEYTYQARENICRAVERAIFGKDAARGWLPVHGHYWN